MTEEIKNRALSAVEEDCKFETSMGDIVRYSLKAKTVRKSRGGTLLLCSFPS